MGKGLQATPRSLTCRNLYSAGLEYAPNLDVYAEYLKTEKQVLQACISYYTHVLAEPPQEARNNALVRRWQARIEDIDAQVDVIKKAGR